MLIVFIHHIAMLIQAPNVVAAVADDLDDAIVRLFPEKLGDPVSDDDPGDDGAASFEETKSASPLVVHSKSNGYVQAIDVAGLMDLAREKNLLVRLTAKPGDFLAVGTPLAKLWFADEKQVDDEVEQCAYNIFRWHVHHRNASYPATRRGVRRGRVGGDCGSLALSRD